MRVAAQDVQPGDRVRGIGLVVEFSEPQDDFNTRLEGSVSRRDPNNPGEFVGTNGVVVVLPNEHIVNVRRSDEAFHADQVRLIEKALEKFNADAPTDAYAIDDLVAEFARIGNMARGRYVGQYAAQKIVNELSDTSANAEQILDALYWAEENLTSV